YYRELTPKDPGDSDFVYRQAVRAKAYDALRGLLPAAALSNVGIYGTGQGFEQLLLRMRASELPEAVTYADLMLEELRKVIPSFLRVVAVTEGGGAWSSYLAPSRTVLREVASGVLADDETSQLADSKVTLVDY